MSVNARMATKRQNFLLRKAADRETALAEYEFCRQGIDRYDEHLFRIRQWNIALAAVALAGIIGLAQVGGGDGISGFQSSVALFVFTAISFAFWWLDALNKSLQMVHIHNSRDIEKFLRGTSDLYIGPTISLRFQRKEKRHTVATVKNLTDETVMAFHLLPILIFWLAVFLKLPPELCLQTSCPEIETSRIVARTVAIGSLIGIACMMYLSFFWKHGSRFKSALNPTSKYFLRFHAARRRRMYEKIFTELNGQRPCECADKRLPCAHLTELPIQPLSVPPFRADFHDKQSNTLLFIDRIKISRDPFYLAERQKWLKSRKYTVYSATWDKMGFPGQWRIEAPGKNIMEQFPSRKTAGSAPAPNSASPRH